jgi:hypothetical protein
MVKNIPDFLKKGVGLYKQLSDKQPATIIEGSEIVSYESHDAVVRFGD